MPGAPTEPRLAVARAVQSVLDAEARANEMRVSVVRTVGYASVFVLDIVFAALDLRPVVDIAQSATCLVAAIAALALLRSMPVVAWYKYAVPPVDALMLGWILDTRLEHHGARVGLTATTALVCALFAMTGAVRFARSASLWTTFVAAALFLFLLGPRGDTHGLIYSLAALFSIGLLAMWLADVVRRSMEGAAGMVFLQRFLPRELVESAFADPLAGFAEPRVVAATVLVSDLRGFTTLAERVPPERVFAFLSELQGDLARVVHAHGGAVDKFLGDGMLAVFGATEATAHEARAIAAAREIRAVVERLNARNLLGAPLKVGIGLHAGSLVAGCLGSGDRLEATVIGDTVNTASRLESMTKELGVDVLMSESVKSGAGEVSAVPLGEVALRGREQLLRVYTLA